MCKPGDKKIIDGVTLTYRADGRWVDNGGTVWAISENSLSADKEVRCGIGFASLPQGDRFTDGCRAHDFAFSNSNFQSYHTRSEADRMLLNHLLLISGNNRVRRLAAHAMYRLTRAVSWLFWDDPKTRWK